MAISQTPEQEIPQSNWTQHLPMILGISTTINIGTGTGPTTGSVASTAPAYLKSRAVVLARGPAASRSTSAINPAFKIESLELDFDYVTGFQATDTTSYLNILVAKVPQSVPIYGAENGTAATTIQVSDPFAKVTSSAGLALVAASGRTLARATLQSSAGGSADYIPRTRTIFDLGADVVATTAANSVTKTEEDLLLYPGDKLVGIFLPCFLSTGTPATDAGTGTVICNGNWTIRLSKYRV